MTTPADIVADFRPLEEKRMERENELHRTSVAIFETEQRLSQTKATIKKHEADIWINGGAGKVVIDGKNEKIREAQFVQAAQQVPQLVASYADQGEMEAGIANMERYLANIRLIIRGIDYSMQIRIEQFQYLNTPRFYRGIE